MAVRATARPPERMLHSLDRAPGRTGARAMNMDDRARLQKWISYICLYLWLLPQFGRSLKYLAIAISYWEKWENVGEDAQQELRTEFHLLAVIIRMMNYKDYEASSTSPAGDINWKQSRLYIRTRTEARVKVAKIKHIHTNAQKPSKGADRDWESATG